MTIHAGAATNGLAGSFDNGIATIQKERQGYRNLHKRFMKIHRDAGGIGSELERVLRRRPAW